MGSARASAVAAVLLLFCIGQCTSFGFTSQASSKARLLQHRAGLRMVVEIGSLPMDSADLQSGRLTKARDRLRSATLEAAGGAFDEATGLRKESRVRELVLKVAEPEVRYDPKKLEQQLFRQPATWLLRNVQLFFPLARFTLSVLSDINSGKERQYRKKRAEELMRIISGLGPAIIKAGQALSSRPDLLPKEYLDELQKLQDRLPPFSNEEAYAVINEELGQPWNEVYEFLEPDPVAAASIGQVYKARLRSNGHIVALKVQRPGCEQTISLDLYILRWYSALVTKGIKALGRDVDLGGIIDDFGELIFREIDYRAEMVNCQRFAELYANIPGVYVPKIYNSLTRRRVLTMEWVEGDRLVDKARLEAKGLDPSLLVDTLVQCTMRQLLENGLFHADPHAGNLLAMKDGQLCFLDFGMVSYVEAQQRYGIMEAVVHLVNRDFNSLANLYKRLGFIPPEQDTEPIVRALELALPDVLNASVSELNFKNVINKLGDVMYTYPFSLPPYYIAIIRCLGVLEGVAIQADPQFRIISDAYPYIASRLLTDSSPELQSALQQLVFKDGRPRWERFEELLMEAQNTRDYDVTMALNQMLDYLLSENGRPIREQLSEQLVEGIDQVGTETLEFLTTNLRQASLGSLPALLSGDRQALRRALAAQDLTPALASLLRVAGLISQSEGFNPRRALPLLRRLLSEPEAQRLSVELAQALSERAVSRIIRTVFNVPQARFAQPAAAAAARPPAAAAAARPPAPAAAAGVPVSRPAVAATVPQARGAVNGAVGRGAMGGNDGAAAARVARSRVAAPAAAAVAVAEETVTVIDNGANGASAVVVTTTAAVPVAAEAVQATPVSPASPEYEKALQSSVQRQRQRLSQ